MHGLQFSTEQFYAFAGMPAAAIVERLGKEQGVDPVDLASLMRAKKEALGPALNSIIPVACVKSIVEYAKSRSLPVAVASGGQRVDVLHSLHVCGFDMADFGSLVTAEDVENGKPHPETFLRSAARLGVPPETCVAFEDADMGLESAKLAGMAAVDVRLLPGYPLPN